MAFFVFVFAFEVCRNIKELHIFNWNLAVSMLKCCNFSAFLVLQDPFEALKRW